MARRTVQFIGLAHSPTGNLNATLRINNVQVFNGTISTATTTWPLRSRQRDADVLFEFELDRDLHGVLPLALEVTGDQDGAIGFFKLQGNYTEFVGLPDNYNPEDKLPFSPDYWNDLCSQSPTDDGRTNIEIDSIPRTRTEDEEADPDPVLNRSGNLATWCWWTATGSIFSCDINLMEYVERTRDSIDYGDIFSVPVTPPIV